MMKHLLLTLCLGIAASGLLAQKNSDVQVFTGAGATQGAQLGSDGSSVHLQVGGAIPYSHTTAADNTSFSIRYPWDVTYIPLTFDNANFEVSKGYFSEKIQLNWTILANRSRIEQIRIYRRPYNENATDDKSNYQLIATLSSDSYTYEDTNTQGGVLYEYKVEAAGVSPITRKYVTYITGVGYRNPTGVVTGSVAFEGSSPVKDVIVRAEPQGGELTFGKSLLMNDGSVIEIPLPDQELENKITLQAWVKLTQNNSGTLFRLKNEQLTTDELTVNYTKKANSLALSVAHTNGQARTFSIANYYPNGQVDGRGTDQFNAFVNTAQPGTEFEQNFVHLSVVLEQGQQPVVYLNGRSISEEYITNLPEDAVNVPTISTGGSYVFGGFKTAFAEAARNLKGNIDEIRLWKTALSETRIRTDFKRYLGGIETNLVAYLRCDEGAGKWAYDISKVGVEFNKNHARLHNTSWTNDKPTASQLGILGVTDAAGNYIISAIPFSGAGESYTITPTFGVHQFEPAQQLVYIGKGSEVINKIDFKDVSSFDFLGVAAYTTTGVFAPIAEVANVTAGSVTEAGYNQYKAIINGREQLVSQHEYYLDPSDNALYETPKIYVAGANVYIDGSIVLDKNKRPVVTDQNGFFKIRVPIGEHFIEVRKDKHNFMHAGRFPAEREDGDDLFEFFEHQQTAVTFLDTTRVTLVGRVVGGTVEAEKPIGFGANGLATDSYETADGMQRTDTISSINNIGVAKIELQYLAPGALPGSEISHYITTNAESGEYATQVLPLSYTIPYTGGISIPTNAGIQLLSANEIVNLSQVPDSQVSQYQLRNGSMLVSDTYHFVKSFTYRSVPVLEVISQASDLQIMTKQKDNNQVIEVPISTEGFPYPIYTQGNGYNILFRTFEEYINQDNGVGIAKRDIVPVTDGEFNITNNLAMPNTESLRTNKDDPSYVTYTFRAGIPSISSPFTRSLNISYRVNGVDYDARNYQNEGIIMGGKSDGSQTFVTNAPEKPDLILRDPPGSNSYASIEKGRSISFTEEGSFAIGQEADYKVEMKMGMKVALGGGIAGPIIEAETVNSGSLGISMKVESDHGRSITRTYTFNETISTSDDPQYIGSDGDLYIGNASNIYYGMFDNIQSNDELIPDTNEFLRLENTDGVSVYISKQKGFYFNEEPSNTFFIYSQKHVLENLIPDLEQIIAGIENGQIEEGKDGVLTKKHYLEQIRIWQKVIQDNEKTKYAALNEREQMRTEIRNKLLDDKEKVNSHLNALIVLGSGTTATPYLTQIGVHTLAEATTMLVAKKNMLDEKLNFLNKEFDRNISFDAGVGEYSLSSEISMVKGNTTNLTLDLDAYIETSMGFKLNETGLLLHTNNRLNSSINTALASDSTNSTIITYTFKDNDKYNFLSVDVVNAFDANGPVFSTLGGQTSCPYEGVDTTHFYNHAAYLADPDKENSSRIYSGGEQLSYATQRVEIPAISVEVASVTDVPETRAAEFKLILENNSTAEADAYFEIYVDNTTNPHNAKINLLPNGQVVFVPYGKKVEYALTLEKSISDVYDYNDIVIVLGSLCDPLNEYATVAVSASFRPACTTVQVDRPLENWVFNAGAAYNVDGTTKPMNVALFGYDRSYTGFEKFTLEYRRATSSSYTRLQTYYNTQELLDAAIAQGEDMGSLITANTTNFAWDIAGMGLADGPYELRVTSYCSNGTEFTSDVISGTVDLNAPQQFGTPSPANGILGPGDDLRLRFSEAITYSSAISKIEIKGESNQQQVDHNVSVYFAGSQNILTIEQPNIAGGSFSLEFWLKRATQNGVLMEQAGGMKVAIVNGNLEWTHGGKTIAQAMASDGTFHHYTLSYNQSSNEIRMYQDDMVLGSVNAAGVAVEPNSNPLVIGGNSFVGNLHDLRFWSKSLSLSEAYAQMYKRLSGTERDLIGYWPMDEGYGALAKDKARFKHAQVQAAWDIKPKGTAYNFANNQYQVLDNVNFVQLSDLMDVTLSFWMKTSQSGKATLFSNGRGNGDDLQQTNGKANKWAVSLENGILYLHSEGNSYRLSNTNLADNRWHHVGIVLRRIGNLRTYVDAQQESTHPVQQIGGLSGNKFWLGARGHISSSLQETIDEHYTGQLDEVRLWNLARSAEQLDRDRHQEIEFNSLGLMLYARMNQPDPATGASPLYYHKAANETVLSSAAKLSSGSVNYTQDAPAVKQVRPYQSFQVSHVINGDELILTPLVSDWSVLEGQILDITVDRMFDVHGNRQNSPITWTAFVRRNEVSWYYADGSQQLNVEKAVGEPYSFTVTLLNKGGKKQPYSVQNLPAWISTSSTSGTLEPNSSRNLTLTIDPELAIGRYTLDLYLDTDYNYDEKLLLDLRVMATGPAWAVDPSAYEHNMNVIGKLKLNGAFSKDPQSKVVAFVGNELRGVAALQYDAQYDEYFSFLTIYSNSTSGEEVTFKVWDATRGKVLIGLLNAEPSLTFIQNELIGSRSVPAIFESTDQLEQIWNLKSGWSWVSVFAEDARLANLNQLTTSLSLRTNDLVKSQDQFDVYDEAGGWNGSLSSGGGMNTRQMYKVKLNQGGSLVLQGKGVDLSGWNSSLKQGWNWLGYPISNNVSINEALALLQAADGDIVKSQDAFAIYDSRTGWSGTLRYLQSGTGYMLKVNKAQEFRYPQYYNTLSNGRLAQPALVTDSSLEPAAWEYNMNVIAELKSNAYYESVWVMGANGELRGYGTIDEVDGRKLSFLTIYGNSQLGETLSIQLGNGLSRAATGATLAFQADGVVGTLQEPLPLSPLENSEVVYPNPFTESFSVGVRAQSRQEVQLIYTDMLGHTMYQQKQMLSSGDNQLTLTPQLPAGVYMLHTVIDGQAQSWKIFKTE